MESIRRTTRFDIDRAGGKLRRGEVKALYSLWHIYLNMDAEAESEPDVEDRYWQAFALYHFGIALQRYKHYTHALDVFSKCVATFGEDSDRDVAYIVNQTLVSAAFLSDGLFYFDRAIQYL